jgi:glycerophosphoryl diester phosphodiesterase
MKAITSLITALLLALCFIAPVEAKITFRGFDLEAHRGGRDLFPENTIPAFQHALDLGVTTLELDCQMTKEGIPVVSHNPKLDSHLTKGPDGKWIPRGKEPTIFAMTLEEVKKYDVGAINPDDKSYYDSHGRTQKAIPGTRIPTLDEVFQLVEKKNNNTVLFNIETKSYADHPPFELGPDPYTFAKALLDVIKKHHLENRVMIQSFDWRTLLEVRRLDKNITLSALTSEQPQWPDGLMREVGRPGCSPWMAGFDIDDFKGDYVQACHAIHADIISPYFVEVTPEIVQEAHTLGMKVVPWTVNRKEEMEKLIDMGVDGIISDRPDLLKEVLQQKKITF